MISKLTDLLPQDRCTDFNSVGIHGTFIFFALERIWIFCIFKLNPPNSELLQSVLERGCICVGFSRWRTPTNM